MRIYNLSVNSLQQSPCWEANIYTVSQQIPRVLSNPKVYYCADHSPPLAPILSRIIPVRVLPTDFFNL